jgi:hypothetical protein
MSFDAYKAVLKAVRERLVEYKNRVVPSRFGHVVYHDSMTEPSLTVADIYLRRH